MFDTLGGLLGVGGQPAAPDTTQQADLETQWKGWLDNPANKAGLIAFGLQAMTGSWGNGASQLATAIGTGLETAAGANKIEQDRIAAERARSDKLGDAESDRALRRELNAADITSRERVANIMASSRLDVANVRSQGGPSSKKEQDLWNKIYSQSFTDIEALGMDEVSKDALARSRADAALHNFRASFGVSGNAPGASGAGGTSTNSANESALDQPIGGSEAPKSTSKNSENSANRKRTVDEVLADPILGPQLKAAISAGTAKKYAPIFSDPDTLDTYIEKIPTRAGMRYKSSPKLQEK